MYSKYTFFNKIVYSRYTEFHLHEGYRPHGWRGSVPQGDRRGRGRRRRRPGDSWLTGPVYFAYESGSCGFQPCRDIRGLGHSCDAIAVTGIPRSPEDRLLKDDRRDAQRLPSEMTKVDSKLKTVYVPTTRVESLRDLTRARYDAVAASRRSKQLV